jgi:hypothetical protein
MLVVEVVDPHYEFIPERPTDPITAFNGDTAGGPYGADAKQRNDLVLAIEDLLHPELLALPTLGKSASHLPIPSEPRYGLLASGMSWS